MVNILIKQDPKRDEYVYWSTEIESFVAYGGRDEMQAYIAEECAHRWPGKPYEPGHSPAEQVARADVCGSSAAGGYRLGYWDDDDLIYEQRGYLARKDFYRAAVLLDAGNDEAVWDLLTPFEDESEVRRG